MRRLTLLSVFVGIGVGATCGYLYAQAQQKAPAPPKLSMKMGKPSDVRPITCLEWFEVLAHNRFAVHDYMLGIRIGIRAFFDESKNPHIEIRARGGPQTDKVFLHHLVKSRKEELSAMVKDFGWDIPIAQKITVSSDETDVDF